MFKVFVDNFRCFPIHAFSIDCLKRFVDVVFSYMVFLLICLNMFKRVCCLFRP